jgi:formate dehydrogenase subunit gamma
MTRLAEIIASHARREGPLLPILQDVQAEFGFVGDEAIGTIATALNMAKAEVYRVVSFYHDFRTAPDPRPVIKLCRAEACQARGVEGLIASMKRRDDVKVESVFCLGLCSVGPAAIVGGEVIARLDEHFLDALIEAVR